LADGTVRVFRGKQVVINTGTHATVEAGSRVTIIERNARLVNREDDDLVAAGRTPNTSGVSASGECAGSLFTDPGFARIGLSEKEAQHGGVAYRLAKIPFSAALRAQTLRIRQWLRV
jgi:pyruvate/2-oxoglutarate dehydrogenase complex dihydrolipoamide dehydrogenase (E3) component